MAKQFDGTYVVLCKEGNTHPSSKHCTTHFMAREEHNTAEKKAKEITATLNADPKMKCGPHKVIYRPAP